MLHCCGERCGFNFNMQYQNVISLCQRSRKPHISVTIHLVLPASDTKCKMKTSCSYCCISSSMNVSCLLSENSHRGLEKVKWGMIVWCFLYTRVQFIWIFSIRKCIFIQQFGILGGVKEKINLWVKNQCTVSGLPILWKLGIGWWGDICK